MRNPVCDLLPFYFSGIVKNYKNKAGSCTDMK